jgi:hypothetical protein
VPSLEGVLQHVARLLRSGYVMLQRRITDSTSITEELLADAEVRLYQAKLDALLGRRYDADEFDRRVTVYREAKRSADAARFVAVQLATQDKGSGASNRRLAA